MRVTESMTKARWKIWKKEVANNKSAAPVLRTLPATNEAFFENDKRAHIQSAIWRNAVGINPPSVNPLDYGWEFDLESQLIATSLSPSVELVPDEVKKRFKCGCKATEPCKTKNCSCSRGSMCCGYCNWEASWDCENPFTLHKHKNDEDDGND